MKMICFEFEYYEVCHCHCWDWDWDCETKHNISGWGCILMTTGCSWRYWNTLNIWRNEYKVGGKPWSYAITCYNWETERIPHCHHCDCETKHISGWGCMLMTTGHCSRCWNTLYMNEVDLLWVWTGWGASIITFHNLQHDASKKPSELPTTSTLPLQEQYQAGAASLWPLATVAGAETLYKYIK
jgi:hypothetical protein